MRVRSALAEALRTSGRSAEAISEFESLLALNPNDNQGLRYALLDCYLEGERLDRARHLFRQFEEGSAMFDWGQVLELYLSGDLEGAVAALAGVSHKLINQWPRAEMSVASFAGADALVRCCSDLGVWLVSGLEPTSRATARSKEADKSVRPTRARLRLGADKPGQILRL
jgi:tetratricopeptide (TPR) repeat protein